MREGWRMRAFPCALRLGRHFSCRGLAVSQLRELLPPGELHWLRRDTGYLEPLLWEHGEVPRSRPSCICRQLPLASKLWPLFHPGRRLRPTLQLSRRRQQLLANSPHNLSSLSFLLREMGTWPLSASRRGPQGRSLTQKGRSSPRIHRPRAPST